MHIDDITMVQIPTNIDNIDIPLHLTDEPPLLCTTPLELYPL